MNIKVTNCQECPFCNTDYEYGKNQCNANGNIVAEGYQELPSDKVHELCPLKTESFTIEL